MLHLSCFHLLKRDPFLHSKLIVTVKVCFSLAQTTIQTYCCAFVCISLDAGLTSMMSSYYTRVKKPKHYAVCQEKQEKQCVVSA